MKYIFLLACCLTACNKAQPGQVTKVSATVDAGIDSGKQAEEEDDWMYYYFLMSNSWE